jgi:hypothetical protein
MSNDAAIAAPLSHRVEFIPLNRASSRRGLSNGRHETPAFESRMTVL